MRIYKYSAKRYGLSQWDLGKHFRKQRGWSRLLSELGKELVEQL